MGSPLRHRCGALAALSALALAVPAAASADADVSVSVTGLRNGNGQVLACLTANPKAFPDCRNDPSARKLRVQASKTGVVLDFGAVPAGSWAVSLIHDENGNGKMDKMGMIPREGYGFSRDAPVMMGPPRFAAAAFAVGPGPVHQTLKVRYIF